jgi:hypothetical protein
MCAAAAAEKSSSEGRQGKPPENLRERLGQRPSIAHINSKTPQKSTENMR